MSADKAAAEGKAELRAAIRHARTALSPRWVAEASATVQARVAALPEFTAARILCGYLALAGEVETGQLLRLAWQAGKRVCVPAYDRGAQRYRLCWWQPEQAVALGRYHVPEPAQPVWTGVVSVDCAVLPGLAFDAQGGRVGHGGGHIDRLLRAEEGTFGYKLGLAFEFQMRVAVPVAAGDVRMDAVVTEARIYGNATTKQ